MPDGGDDVTRKLEQLVTLWLRSERAGEDGAAQQALSRLLRAVPYPVPSPGFSARILARLGRPTVLEQFLARPWGRALVAACLLSAAVALAGAPEAVLALVRMLDLAALVNVGVELTTALTAVFEFGLAVWRVLADVGRALALALSAPAIVWPLLGSALLALLALRVLLQSASLYWSPIHVDSTRS